MMTYNDLIRETQNKINDFIIRNRINKDIIIEDTASLIVDYVNSNNMDINDFDFKKFFMIVEFDWDKEY